MRHTGCSTSWRLSIRSVRQCWSDTDGIPSLSAPAEPSGDRNSVGRFVSLSEPVEGAAGSRGRGRPLRVLPRRVPARVGLSARSGTDVGPGGPQGGSPGSGGPDRVGAPRVGRLGSAPLEKPETGSDTRPSSIHSRPFHRPHKIFEGSIILVRQPGKGDQLLIVPPLLD